METSQDTTPLPPSASIPSLGDTFGAVLLSTFLSLMIYGLTVHQTYRFFRIYSREVPLLKLLVSAIFLVDTFHSATIVHLCYYYFVSSYFNPEALLIPIWTERAEAVLTGINVILTQSFYVRRIYIVNRHGRVIVIVAALMVAETVCILATDIENFKERTFVDLKKQSWIDAILFAIATTVDLILTGSFVVMLRNSRTCFKRTNTVLDRMAIYAVIATSLNAAFTVPAFICSIALPRSFASFAIAIPATKVYSSSVLAILNCRQSLAGHAASTGLDPAPIRPNVMQRTDRSSESEPATQETAFSSEDVINIKAIPTRSVAGEDGTSKADRNAPPQDDATDLRRYYELGLQVPYEGYSISDMELTAGVAV